MNLGISITRDRCEKCKSTKDIILSRVFNVFPIKLCVECWREWEFFMLSNKDCTIFKALDREYREGANVLNPQQKREIVDTNNEVIRNLYPTLVEWIGR